MWWILLGSLFDMVVPRLALLITRHTSWSQHLGGPSVCLASCLPWVQGPVSQLTGKHPAREDPDIESDLLVWQSPPAETVSIHNVPFALRSLYFFLFITSLWISQCDFIGILGRAKLCQGLLCWRMFSIPGVPPSRVTPSCDNPRRPLDRNTPHSFESHRLIFPECWKESHLTNQEYHHGPSHFRRGSFYV